MRWISSKTLTKWHLWPRSPVAWQCQKSLYNSANDTSTNSICGACKLADETVDHIFFCPHYTPPRKFWIKPLCNNLGIRHLMDARRIILTNTAKYIVFARSKCLYAFWLKRLKLQNIWIVHLWIWHYGIMARWFMMVNNFMCSRGQSISNCFI